MMAVDARTHASPTFEPPALLRNPHCQAVLATSKLRRWVVGNAGAGLIARSREVILDCGEGVRLQGFYTPAPEDSAARGLVVLLHGWEGSAESTYLLATGARLQRAGFALFRLNLRDHGDSHHLNEGIFHSCRLNEAIGAVAAVQQRWPDQPLSLAGFSLGGNFALRIAHRAPDAGIELTHSVAVSPVIDPAHGLEAMERAPGFYQTYFLRKWRRSLKHKQALFPGRFRFEPVDRLNSVREMTRFLIEHEQLFPSLEAYLDGYSIARQRLAGLRVPSTVITASDDPIIPVEDFYELPREPTLELEITRHGGHCGFLDNLRLCSWAERHLCQRLVAATEVSAQPAVAGQQRAG